MNPLSHNHDFHQRKRGTSTLDDVEFMKAPKIGVYHGDAAAAAIRIHCAWVSSSVETAPDKQSNIGDHLTNMGSGQWAPRARTFLNLHLPLRQRGHVRAQDDEMLHKFRNDSFLI